MGHKIWHLPFCSYFQKWSEKNNLEGIVGYPRTFTIILTNKKKIPARTCRMSQTALLTNIRLFNIIRISYTCQKYPSNYSE